jgi:tetratricopeptide (TPR) repeat protein
MPRILAPARQRILPCCAAVLFALLPISAAAPQTAGSSTLRGAVHDSQGKPAAGATVHLRIENEADVLTARTDEQGRFSFEMLRSGVYVLQAEMSGRRAAKLASIFIGAQQTKEIDLTLGPAGDAVASKSSPAPEFFDQPQFTVSGVTDTTSLGGHGSDTIVRTRETLAKETASLGKSPAEGQPVSVATEGTLRAKIEREPHDFEANRELGEFLTRHGDGRRAMPYLERASELKPDDYESAYELALANADAANYEPARVNAQALLVHHDTSELHHLLADVQEKLGNSLDAVREYQRAAELDPKETYLFDWGSELLLHHAPEPAFEVFTKGNRLFAHSVRMLIGIGATWFARGSYDQAVERICEASDLNPDDPTPYLFLGKIESAQTPRSEALVEKLHRFVTLQPENAEANYFYAVGLWKRRKTPTDPAAVTQVESLLNKAIHLDSKFAAAYLQLGILHSDQGDFSRAISDYGQAIRADDETQTHADAEEAHYRLAQVYRQTGAADKAKAELRLYDEAVKESAQQSERERHEIRQFVYTLRDQPPPQKQ